MNKRNTFFHKITKAAVPIAIICTAALLIACLIPSKSLPKVNAPFFDKWVHFLAFAIWSLSICSTFKTFNWKKVVIVILASFFFGWIIELLQASGITYGRSYETMDILADGIGGILGTLLYLSMVRSTNSK